MAIKLYSWNVNGIRAIIKKGFYEFLEQHKPDIICLQETKAAPEQVSIDLPGFEAYWCVAEKKGYSGTAVFTRIPPLQVMRGIGSAEHDREGRVLTLEFTKAFLVNVYTPNSQEGLRRLEYRTELWDKAFLEYVKALELQKPVIICGDLNVAHKDIDIANPRTNQKTAGFTPEERASFDRFLNSGFIDTFRRFNNEPHQYTWWSYRMRARERNVGWRIDYVCVSEGLGNGLLAAAIHPDVMGSDHCPVSLELHAEALI